MTRFLKTSKSKIHIVNQRDDPTTVNEILGDEIERRRRREGKKVSETVLLTHVASFSNVIMT